MRVSTKFALPVPAVLFGLILVPRAALAQAINCPVEPATNVPIADGEVYAGSNCNLYAVGDIDGFQFSASNGETYQFAVGLTGAINITYLCLNLVNSNNTSLNSGCTNYSGYGAMVQFDQPLTAGTYTMQVYQSDSNATQNYAVSLERLYPFPPNAQQITSFAKVFDGDIFAPTDTNAWLFNGATTGTYEVTASLSNPITSTYLCLSVYSPGGTLVKPSSGTNPACTNYGGYGSYVQIDFTPTQDGQYMEFLYEGAYQDLTQTYTLEVSCVVGICPTMPAISSLSPPAATAGGPPFTLTVDGSGFLSGATVQWNGSALVTTYVSENQLTAAVLSSDIAAPGSANVTVMNPGGSISNPITFMINQPLRFISMLPCRVVDTRDPTKPSGFGPPSLSGGATPRSFSIPNGSCGIPATAQAYSLNVTVVPDGELGYLTLWPTGYTPQPVVSTMNSLDGEVKANAAIVAAGTGGAISIYAANDTDVVLDINGYFVLNTVSSGLGFYPMTPCRLVDTRPGAPSTIITGTLAARSDTTLPILSSASCHVPSTAQAYSLNFTLVPPGPVGYLTVYPTGESRPVVSTLNDPTGTVEANAAIAPAGTGGDINVYVTDTTNLLVDINGYFAPVAEGALSLYALPPCRVLDTRNPPGSPPFVGAINVNVGSDCGATSAAQAYVFNATVVPQGFLGYLTLWPEGTVQPVVSTLNAYNGEVTSNMAIVPTNNTEISAFASNSTYLILDIFGYFAP